MISNFLHLLACPDTGKDLTLTNDKLQISGKDVPCFEGVYCLYDNPEQTLSDWNSKIQTYLKREKLNLKHLQHKINEQKNALTRKRLSRTQEASSHNLKAFEKTLKPLLKEDPVDFIASSQQIHSYFHLIFRDWCWKEDELNTYVDFIAKNNLNDKSVLVLGSGAGGLSYQIAKKFKTAKVVSIEHNPFLAITADEIMQGERVKLFDYSYYPKNLEASAQKQEIKVEPVGENHITLLATFPNLPVKEESFDYIIAPWFFDILDIPFNNAIYCAQDFLKDDGNLLFFGPANVHKKAFEDQFCQEEIIETFKGFFENCTHEQKTIEYMHSPLESQNRLEEVLFINASGKKEIDMEAQLDTAPTDLKMTPALEQYKMTIEVKSKILSHITKNTTYEELAKILEQHFGLEDFESLIYAKKFINQINIEI